MPQPDPSPAPMSSTKPTQSVRLSMKLLGAEFQWFRSPAPPGIELRDYFAATALSGYMFHVSEDSGALLITKVARVAYRMADEMLKARSAVPGPTPRADSLAGESDQRAGIE